MVSYVSRHDHIVLRHAPLIHLNYYNINMQSSNLFNVDSKTYYFFNILGKCGSVWVRLIPAPRGTGIVSAPVPKKLLMMAGIEDCYTSAKGCTGTLGNFGKTVRFSRFLIFIDVILCAGFWIVPGFSWLTFRISRPQSFAGSREPLPHGGLFLSRGRRRSNLASILVSLGTCGSLLVKFAYS